MQICKASSNSFPFKSPKRIHKHFGVHTVTLKNDGCQMDALACRGTTHLYGNSLSLPVQKSDPWLNEVVISGTHTYALSSVWGASLQYVHHQVRGTATFGGGGVGSGGFIITLHGHDGRISKGQNPLLSRRIRAKSQIKVRHRATIA